MRLIPIKLFILFQFLFPNQVQNKRNRLFKNHCPHPPLLRRAPPATGAISRNWPTISLMKTSPPLLPITLPYELQAP